MPVSAHIAHHVPGRMRIRVAGGKRHLKLLASVKESVAKAHGVTRVEINENTGSVVIHYRHKTLKLFAEGLREQGLSSQAFQLSAPEVGEAGEMWSMIEHESEFLAAHSQLARSVVKESKRLDVAVKEATDNTLDLKVLVPLGLAVVSFVYLGTDISTPLWLSLGVFSFNSFVSLHPALPYAQTKDDEEPRNQQR